MALPRRSVTTMRISISEMQANLSRYLREAMAGQDFEVTSHGRVVARVIGVPDTSVRGAARLVATGAATWSGGKPAGSLLKLHDTGSPISTMVLQDRA
jgi:prevent-host-death family protein